MPKYVLNQLLYYILPSNCFRICCRCNFFKSNFHNLPDISGCSRLCHWLQTCVSL